LLSNFCQINIFPCCRVSSKNIAAFTHAISTTITIKSPLLAPTTHPTRLSLCALQIAAFGRLHITLFELPKANFLSREYSVWKSSTLLEMEWSDCLLVFVSNQLTKSLSFSTLNAKSFHGHCLLQSFTRSMSASMIPGSCQVSLML